MALTNSVDWEDYRSSYVNSTDFLMAESKRRIEAKEQQIKDLENELDLLKHQAYGFYREHVQYYFPGESVLNKANNWIQMLKSGTDMDGKKLDKRKKYKEKEYFNYVTDHVSKLLDVDVTITGIMDFNFGEANIIEFEAEGYNWQLTVPIIDHIPFKRFDYLTGYSHKIKLAHRPSNHLISTVGATFEEDELKGIMQEALKKVKEENNGNT